MGKDESLIENYLISQVKKAGGKAYKFLPFAEKGMPDRLIALRGSLYFVETKAPNGNLSDIQQAKHRELKQYGITVYVLWTATQVYDWLSKLI